MTYGTLNTLDTLASLRAATGVVAEIGEDVAFESINAALQTHSMLLKEALTDFVEMTTDRLRRYGGPDTMALEELDEYGTAGAQKIAPGATIGFPMKLYGGALQWTRTYFQNVTGTELAGQVSAMMDADVKNTHKQLKYALLYPTHFLSGKVQVLINQASEAVVRALTGFYPYYDMRLTPSLNAVNATNANLDVVNLTNRAIGVYGPAEIWVKPWIPANYMVAMQMDTQQKALVMRTRNAGGGNLELDFDVEEHPLRARHYGREFGFGVWNRVAAAVLYTNGGSYTSPALSSL